MSQPFPADPFFVGNYAPLSFEADAPDLPLRGALPKNLAGTLKIVGDVMQYEAAPLFPDPDGRPLASERNVSI